MSKSEDIELGGVCVKVFNEDCLNVLREMPSNSVDSIVSDPPYGISFMAKKWDYDVPSVDVWKEALRVLKPGGHALIACGTRTQHRMVCNIEDAGFEVRDVVSWIYGSGFPKSLNIHKQDERCPDGWGTALKPACEFFTLCRKPLSEKTVAANVLKWGTGGINIDGCRVGMSGATKKVNTEECRDSLGKYGDGLNGGTVSKLDAGRFPSNLIHDGSQEVLDLFPETKPKESAARFFYCAKASKKDRNEGCGEMEKKTDSEATNRKEGSPGLDWNDGKGGNAFAGASSSRGTDRQNHHPTVKPTSLMAYLCRLITPPNGVVLDPYMGSGSTGKAAVREGFSFVGCEIDADYYKIAKARVCS